MKWSVLVLFFQAFITFILGVVFFSQVMVMNMAQVSELNVQVGTTDTPTGEIPEQVDIKKRYTSASYLLLLISISELIILFKIFL